LENIKNIKANYRPSKNYSLEKQRSKQKEFKLALPTLQVVPLSTIRREYPLSYQPINNIPKPLAKIRENQQREAMIRISRLKPINDLKPSSRSLDNNKKDLKTEQLLSKYSKIIKS
jgi:hypothetical protein